MRSYGPYVRQISITSSDNPFSNNSPPLNYETVKSTLETFHESSRYYLQIITDLLWLKVDRNHPYRAAIDHNPSAAVMCLITENVDYTAFKNRRPSTLYSQSH